MEKKSSNGSLQKIRQEKVVLRRIRAIDAEIRNGSYPNTKQLAEKLEVGIRTISRDLDEMRLFYNAPIAYDRIKNGYYYTENSFYIKDISLSEGELFTIALFEKLISGYRNTPIEKSLRSVFRKITESLGERTTIDSILFDDSINYITDPLVKIDVDVFNSIFLALGQNKEIIFNYRPLQKKTYMARTIKPYHVVCQKGNWYVIGYDNYSDEIRIFAFSRIHDVTFSGNNFIFPKDFDWHKYIDEDIGVWLSSKKLYTIHLRFSSEIATFAEEHIWCKNQKIINNDDGTIDIIFETTQLPEVQRWVLGQGHTVKVLQPQELIDSIQNEIEKIIKIYKNE